MNSRPLAPQASALAGLRYAPTENRTQAREDTTGEMPRINHEDLRDACGGVRGSKHSNTRRIEEQDFITASLQGRHDPSKSTADRQADFSSLQQPREPNTVERSMAFALPRHGMRRVAVERLGTFHQRLGQRRVRMHGERDVFRRCAHFERERGFGD